ncbi:MAG: hypothetical protein RMI92_05920 [Geminocystis sp.]|nr:hypothetical protein [Geminocystis sp.]MDW8115394.1 hypothetical protein [Geminocystis sp.]MDW8115958.1 hypothetical protein [Geminocystis sp.]MDW8463701.1 hypothetical protein [Geminocystis sp.]
MNTRKGFFDETHPHHKPLIAQSKQEYRLAGKMPMRYVNRRITAVNKNKRMIVVILDNFKSHNSQKVKRKA